jgi:hypothetical protein
MAVANQVVQACHVAAEWGMRDQMYEVYLWDKTLVVVTVPDLPHLVLWQRKLDLKSLEYSVFHEPDMANTLTAIACLTDSNIFDTLPLWSST